MSSLPIPSFLDHTPVPLAFGTSGLRGLVQDITDLEAYVNVKGAIRYLLAIDDIRAGSDVLVGGDLRPSTDRILRACVQAIVGSGCHVENAGKLPTPALLLHGISTQRACVMVTGSHIPFDRNGIKPGRSVGEVLKSDEPGILDAIQRMRAEEYAMTAATSAFDASGMLKRPPELPPVSMAARGSYERRYLEAFPPGALRGLRLVFYQHSAVGRDLVPRILAALGAEVIAAGRSDTFVPIDTENIGDEQLELLEEMVATTETGAGPVDAIVSTDGDSDRPLVAAVGPLTERGRRVRFLPGDMLGLVAAEYLRADAVAVPISANDGIEHRLRELGVALQKTKIGSPYVVAALETERRGRARRAVGWEANGGFLVGNDLELGAGTLRALPTRDAVLPIVANLAAAVEQGIRLDALWSRLPSRFGRAGLIDNVPVPVSRALMASLIPDARAVEVSFGTAGRADHRWQDVKVLLERFFTPELGFGTIARMNVLDGVRIHFSGGDVAHLRPSGNAPQLRVYANAGSQSRADRIVELCLREPDGILRRLVKAFA